MSHYVFVDMSGSVVHYNGLFAEMMGVAVGQGSNDIYGFSSDVFPYVFGDPLPKMAGMGTDLRSIAHFLSRLPSYPDKVTVISDGNFFPKDADPRWNMIEVK